MKKRKTAGLVLLLILILCGCSAATMAPAESDSAERSLRIYYVNKNATKVVSEDYIPENTDPNALLQELLTLLATDPDDLDSRKVIPSEVRLLNAFIENKQVNLVFDSAYSLIPRLTEVLNRAAIVRTLTQIEGVETVSFSVNEQPLMDALNQPVGQMRASDFIDDLGGDINDYQKTVLTLYFENEQGDRLIECRQELVYNNAVSMERLVMEQLIKGPTEAGMYPVLPAETKLLNISTREGVCYVNLDASFLTGSVNTNEIVPIYAIVNSLAELSAVNKVQIAINGETSRKYRELVSLDTLFERNLDIILEDDPEETADGQETEAVQ